MNKKVSEKIILISGGSDGLGLAICHIWRGGANSKIKSAVAAEKKRLAALR